MDPAELERILKALHDALVDIYIHLPPAVREAVRAQWKALLAAITAARAAGPALAAANLRAILEALRAFLAALVSEGWHTTQLRFWIQFVEAQLAKAGAVAEGGAAGAGLTAAAVLLVLIAILSVVMSIYHIALALGPTDAPVGGAPCGPGNPIARGLEAEDYSHFGQRVAFKAAEAEARRAAQGFTCQGRCPNGTCRGNCVITDITYKNRWFWTWCYVKYEVWCECY